MKNAIAPFLLLIAALIAPTTFAQSASDDDKEVVNAMNEALQDEYRAHATYRLVIATFGPVPPFVHLASAKARHVQLLMGLYAAKKIETPFSKWNQGNVPAFASVEAACTASVKSVAENIALLERLLKLKLPADVRQAFETLRSDSEQIHLPAFRSCAPQ